MGAQVPRAAFACISKLSDALSVRGDKRYAMRCRKKPRDALSVRTTGKGLAQIVTTEMIATTGSRWGTREKSRAREGSKRGTGLPRGFVQRVGYGVPVTYGQNPH